jgi:5'(3')-deoxyribonucleotidase
VRLGFDIDGCLADFNGRWRSEYERWFGVEPPDGFLPFGAEGEAYLQENTVFQEEGQFWSWTDAVPDFWSGMPTIPGAMGAVYQLERAGHEIVLITSRHKKARPQTEQWVQRNWPTPLVGRKLPRLEHVYKSQKGTIDCQIYVDDNPEVLNALTHKPCVIVFDQPWNREVKSTDRVHRARGWGQVVSFVETVSQGFPIDLDEEQDPVEDLRHALVATGNEPVQ